MGIELRNVTKKYGTNVALNQVNLSFEPNHIYGLLGNNGAGKTTLLSLIANRIFADEGEILIDEESNQNNDRALGKVFMMSDANLYPEDMKVKKAIKYMPLFYPAFDTEYAKSLIEKFHLQTNKKITALSTGQQNIFRLILALSSNAQYLLMDEPVLGLDACNRDLFYRLLLERYSEHPFCAIISTHLIQEIENLTEHTIILRNGKLLTNQDTEALRSNCYCVSGPAAIVDSYCADKNILFENRLGGLKTVSIKGSATKDQLPAGLELSNISIQDYFIQLMNEEERNHE